MQSGSEENALSVVVGKERMGIHDANRTPTTDKNSLP
jgi:hypothetical protein